MDEAEHFTDDRGPDGDGFPLLALHEGFAAVAV